MNQYKIKVNFQNGTLKQPDITLVKGDYNSTEFIFEFDVEGGRNIFELKRPDGKIFIKDIIDNKIKLVDYDEELNSISLIPMVDTYTFEITNYNEDSKLTLQEYGYFYVKDEEVKINNSEVEGDNRLPILDALINDVEQMKESTTELIENTNKNLEYAKEQGDYAKEQAQKIIDSNNQATEIIDNFEENVETYTSNFNKNADNKLEAYNQNDTDKTNSYNENANTKLEEYNDNHTEKMNAYNTNASNQIKSYNDNATSKINEYNTNHTNKLKVYNDNDADKTTAYNNNHDSKLSSYNTNATQKETNYNANSETKLTEYNDNHTAKIQEYNDNADTRVNEFNEEVETLRDELNDCYNNQLLGKAEGTSIQVKDSADARMRVLEIDGATNQKITVQSKNICPTDFSEWESGQYNTIGEKIDEQKRIRVTRLIKVIPNEIYFVNTASSNDIFAIREYNDKGLFINNISSIVNHSTFTVSSDGYYIGVTIYSNTNENRDYSIYHTLFDSNEIKPFICLNSEIDKTYEQFMPDSPSPEYPQKIEVLENTIEAKIINKNYFDYDYQKSEKFGISFEYDKKTNEVIVNGTPERNYINWFTNHIVLNEILENGKTYTLSNSKYNVGVYVQIIQEEKNTSEVINIHTRENSRSITFDFEKYNYKLNIMTGTIEQVSTLNNLRIKFQLEKGNKATEIISHQKDSIEIDLKDNFVAKINDDIKDTLGIENGHAILKKRIGKIILDGSESWVKDSLPRWFCRDYNSLMVTPTNNDTKAIAFSTVGIVSATDTAFKIANGLAIHPNGSIYVSEDVKKILDSDKEIILYYLLKESYEVDLGPVKLPKTFKNISNIFLNANLETNMKLEYVKDTNIVIENLQNQIDNITTLLSTSSTSALLLDNLQSDLESEVI